MDIEVQGVLVNFLIIFLCQLCIIFFHNSKLVKINDKFRLRILIFLASALSIILSMTFAFEVLDGYLYDLRYIPLFLGTVYGGMEVGIGLFLVLNIYRLTMGGFGFILSFIASSILTIAGIFFSKYFHKFRISKKFIIALLLLNSTPLYTAITHWFLKKPQLPNNQWLVNAVILSLGTILIIYFTEMIFKQLYIRQQMIDFEKSITVSHLAASIAHEIRNPLTTVKGFLQLLFVKEFDEKRRSYYKTIFSELDRAAQIIHDYLTFAKSHKDGFSTIDTKDEIEKTLSILGPLARKNNVAIRSDLKSFLINGNVQQFVQAIINIVKNGIEAMPDGGEMEITSRSGNKKVVIHIRDTGCGLSKDQLANLGQPYFSTKGEKGTGLGLLVTFNIIHTMDGTINVESELGKGTTFILSFPLNEDYQTVLNEVASHKEK